MNLTSAQLRKAAALQDKIEAMQKELAGLLGVSSGSPAKSAADAAAPAKKRKISAAGRKRIAEAQRARWAKQKAAAAAKAK
jgi:hypothetical protein